MRGSTIHILTIRDPISAMIKIRNTQYDSAPFFNTTQEIGSIKKLIILSYIWYFFNLPVAKTEIHKGLERVHNI